METLLVQTSEELARACASLAPANILGLDTEFIRETTYVPQLCLVQVTDGETIYLIDALKIENLEPIEAIFLNPKPIKILHSGEQDLEIFYRRTGHIPGNLFDTQIAAALLGLGDAIGLSGLVRRLLGRNLSKGQTRSDWSRRPLTRDQIRYAAADVTPLHSLHEVLTSRLEQRGRSEWMASECSRLENSERFDPNPEVRLRQFRKAWKLSRQELSILREVIGWRETQALERNVPRNRIASDSALLALAQRKPRRQEDLQGYRDLPPRLVRRSHSQIIETVRKGRERPESEWPEPFPPPQIDPALAGVVDLLSAYLRLRAAELELSAALLASRRTLEELVLSHPADAGDVHAHPTLAGWRADLLGLDFIRILHGEYALAVRPAGPGRSGPGIRLVEPPADR